MTTAPPGDGAGVAGVAIGHWSDLVARTGVTVALLPPGTTASGEIRGGSPGTREWGLLDPSAAVDAVDAVVLTGGSAFGLAACDGVVAWCERRGRGWPTPAGPVPIVVGLVLYDLAVGDPAVRPGPAEGYAACEAAVPGLPPTGAVGAGAGATVGKWRPGVSGPGGLGTAVARDGRVTVMAAVAVNALGEIREPGPDPDLPAPGSGSPSDHAPGPGSNTTIGLVVTDAVLSKGQCHLLARAAHDGLARAVEPAHTAYDGDAFVVAATGGASAGSARSAGPDAVPADLHRLAILTTRVVEAAIRQGVAAGRADDGHRPGDGSDPPVR